MARIAIIKADIARLLIIAFQRNEGRLPETIAGYGLDQTSGASTKLVEIVLHCLIGTPL